MGPIWKIMKTCHFLGIQVCAPQTHSFTCGSLGDKVRLCPSGADERPMAKSCPFSDSTSIVVEGRQIVNEFKEISDSNSFYDDY